MIRTLVYYDPSRTAADGTNVGPILFVEYKERLFPFSILFLTSDAQRR